MARKVKAPETLADRLYRALQRARENGVALYMEHATEEWFATSGTMPGVCYRVSKAGCSCQGFASFGVCQHHALYLDRFNLRPATAAELDAAITERDYWNEQAASGAITSAEGWRYVLRVRQRAESFLRLATPEPMPPAPAALPVPAASVAA